MARDDDAENEVNVARAVADASTRGLGSNAYNASLVVIPDDGTRPAKAPAPGATKTACEGIGTGRKVQVQLAIVVDHADGDHVVRDILERTLNRSWTEPSFTTGFLRIATVDDTGSTPHVNEFATGTVPLDVMYCVGCNENFGNYRADADPAGHAAVSHEPGALRSGDRRPAEQRELRGLRHSR